MSEGDRQRGADTRHLSPRLGQQPEHRQQAVLDARELADDELCREAIELLCDADVNSRQEPRPAMRRHNELASEERQPRVDRDSAIGVGPRPRSLSPTWSPTRRLWSSIPSSTSAANASVSSSNSQMSIGPF
jgi:hypothetical protein